MKAENYNNALFLALKGLMEKKSRRDNCNFTIYQLAKAINMPHSILIKLMHSDHTKRVVNPRIDTLTKIVDFFKSDGFNVSLDDLLFGKEIDIQTQIMDDALIKNNIQTYSLDYQPKKLGIIEIKLPEPYKNLIAFLADEDIKPMFKKGSLFIVEKDLKPEDDNLVAVKMENYKKILIGKFKIIKGKNFLISLDETTNPIPLLPTAHYSIFGVVVQVNAKT